MVLKLLLWVLTAIARSNGYRLFYCPNFNTLAKQLIFWRNKIRVVSVEYKIEYKMETRLRLNADSRATVQVSASDKEIFNRLKGDRTDWQLFRSMLALYMTHAGEDAA